MSEEDTFFFFSPPTQAKLTLNLLRPNERITLLGPHGLRSRRANWKWYCLTHMLMPRSRAEYEYWEFFFFFFFPSNEQPTDFPGLIRVRVCLQGNSIDKWAQRIMSSELLSVCLSAAHTMHCKQMKFPKRSLTIPPALLSWLAAWKTDASATLTIKCRHDL